MAAKKPVAKKTRRPTAGVTSGGLQDLPLPAPGLVRLRAVDRQELGLIAELNGPVNPTGVGGLDVVQRERQIAISTFIGRDPLRLPIPLLLDGWQKQTTVEPLIRVLERMAGLDPLFTEPATLVVEGFGIPHSYTRDPARRWGIATDFEWGDDVRLREDGHRVYAELSLTLLELTHPEKVGDGATSTGNRRTYTVPPAPSTPRTLRGIARKFKTDWRKVRALNKDIKAVPGDPDKAIATNTKVRYS